MSCSSSSSGGSEGEDEGIENYRKGGYHAVRIGDQFAGGRYVAQRKLGWGQFSTVWLAFDTRSSKYVALKIQKSGVQFAQAALHEVELLSAIANGDPSNSKCVVRLIDHFKHSGPNGQHLCMILEFMGDSLLQLIKYNRYKGLELNKVREICKCILIGLDYLHRELGLIHTDLKPENILLCSTIDPAKDPIRSGTAPVLERPEGCLNGGSTMSIIEKRLKRRAKRAAAKISGRRSSMGGANPKSRRNLDSVDVRCKLVDFGNACWADKQFTEEIQTRQYRAPEVILQSGYSFSVDMWSFACTAFELATGDMLFAPKVGHGFSEDEVEVNGCTYMYNFFAVENVNGRKCPPFLPLQAAEIDQQRRAFSSVHVSMEKGIFLWDHLALMMELLGKIPKKIATGGVKSKDFFDRYGDLKRIRRLKFWPLDRLLVDRYKFPESEASEFAGFLSPIFDFAPEKRPTAQHCLQHPWLALRKQLPPASSDTNDKSNMENLEAGVSNLQIKR